MIHNSVVIMLLEVWDVPAIRVPSLSLLFVPNRQVGVGNRGGNSANRNIKFSRLASCSFNYSLRLRIMNNSDEHWTILSAFDF